MLYTTFTVKDKDYKLRLTAKGIVDLEKKLGTNPINPILVVGQNGQLPSLDVMLTILQTAMATYEHGITMDKMYDIYDDFVEDGNSLMDLVPVLIEVFKTAGFLPKDNEEAQEQANEKN